MGFLRNCTDEFKREDKPALEKWAYVVWLCSYHLKLDGESKSIPSKYIH